MGLFRIDCSSLVLGTANGANFTDGLDGSGIICYRIDCYLLYSRLHLSRAGSGVAPIYMCSRTGSLLRLFGIQCISGTCVHGRYRITGIGWICCVDSVYAADATDYIDRCIYLSGRGAFCYYSGCKLQDNWKASI